MKTRGMKTVAAIVLTVCTLSLLSGKANAAAFADIQAEETQTVVTEVKNGWVDEADGRRYYENDIPKTGTMVAIPDASGVVYYYSFDANGILLYGIVTGADGALYYHTNTDAEHLGAAASGWQQIGDKIYYFDPTTYQAHIGLYTIDSVNYFFESDGAMAVNAWELIAEDTYYFGADGQMAGGLKEIDGKYYYFTETGTMKTNSWVKDGKNKYYMSESGEAYTGAHKIKGKIYVFKSNGKLVKKSGFVTVDKKTYYLNSKGVVKTGYKKIGDNYYYFGSDGAMYKKKWAYVKGYKFYFKKNGKRSVNVSKQIGEQDSYKIVVNKYSNVVTVYAKDGDNGYIIPVRAFICSTGESTNCGTYKIKNQYRWKELIGPCWGQWCSRIYEGVLFHSVYYNSYNDNNSLSVSAYNKLGTTCSHGCVRMTAGDAKWIYDNCSVGTTVKIINKKGKDPFPKPTASKLSSGHTWDPTDPNMKSKCEKNGCH